MSRARRWVGVLFAGVVALSGTAAVASPAAAGSPSSTGVPASVAGAAAADTMPGGYHAVPATRLLDTRDGTGAPAGLRPAGSTTAVTVTGVHGIPATGVSAVALTLVSTGSTANGFLTAFPHGAAAPTASALNWSGGLTVSNLALVKVGTGGQVDLRVSGGASHVVADVVGYVESPDAVPAPGAITAVAPSRLLDTRAGSGAAKAAVRGGTVLQLAVAGRGGVPATGAGSVVLNLTATAGTTRGYVTASPTDPGSAPTSTVNYLPADTVANLVTVGLGPDGGVDLRVTAGGSVHLVADVVGWVAAGAPAAPLGAAPVTPKRLLDTPAVSGSRHSLTVTGVAGVPASGVGAVLLNVTVADPTANGFVQVVPRGAGVPASSSLNFQGGRTKASAVIAAVSSTGGVDLVVSAGASVRLVVDVTGYVLGPPVDTTPPAAPSAVSTTVAGSSVQVSWAPSATPRELTYRVERVVEPKAFPQRHLLVADRHPTTSLTDTAATPGLPTHYAVRAVDGWSTASPEAVSVSRTIPLVIGTPEVVAPTTGGFVDVDCPTSTFCVALERDGGVRTWNGSVWSGRAQVIPRRDDGNPAKGLSAVSCAGPTFCVVTRNDVSGVLVWRDGAWTPVALAVPVNGVSCPTTSRCLLQSGFTSLLTFDGAAVLQSSAMPAGAEWTGLSCPSATFCAVVGRNPSYVPTVAVLNGGAWTTKKLDVAGNEAQDVSCPAVGSCVAVGEGGTYWALASGAWSATRTSAALGSGSNLPRLDCVSAQWCLSDGGDGYSARFTGTSWTAVTGGAVGPQGLVPALSCASTTFCVRASAEGAIRYFRGSTWSASTTVAPASGIFLWLSCSSAANCVGTDLDGAAREWNGSTWSAPLALGLNRGVQCPTDDWCLGTSTDPSSVARYRVRTGTTWGPVVRAGLALDTVSCPEKGWCIAFDATLQASSVYSNGAWSAPVRIPGADGRGYDLDCSSRSRCVMLSNRAHRVWNGTSWSALMTNAVTVPTALECTSTGWCLALEQSGEAWELTGRNTWTSTPSGTGSQNGLSCVSPTFCLEVANIGSVPGAQWVGLTVWGGVQFQVAQVDAPELVWGSVTSCWAVGECFAVSGPRVIRVSVG